MAVLGVLAMLAVLAVLLPVGVARADAPDSLEARAEPLMLADAPGWHRLLHYYPGTLARGDRLSHVDDGRFFLAPDGRNDAAAELRASIDALLGPDAPAATPGSARCRFVARERWLRERLTLPARPVAATCTDYHAWRDTVRADSVTLVFPAAYLNNPSSMFGHTLLRLDPPDIDEGSGWLSWSVNFAADTGSDRPRSAAYAWKGIAGGYPGRFQLQPYFTKLRDYGAIENRDIWEYELDLAPAEVDRLVQHLWELREIRFDYYFFRQNCSFRLLELIDIARPGLDLAAGFPLTAIPADTVRAVADAGLVRGARWLPSGASGLRHDVRAVPATARRLIDALARDPARASDAAFVERTEDVQRDIVVAANRLMTWRARREPASTSAAERRLAMLTLLSGYPPARRAPPEAPSSPVDGHDTRLATFGAGSARGRRLVEAGFRMSYHDLLDRQAGYLPGAAISLGELRVRAYLGGDDARGEADEELRVESFELVSIRSLAAPVPMLPAPSWGVDVGFARDEDVNGGRLGLRLGGLAGVSRAIGDAGAPLLYALAGPSLQVFGRDDDGLGRWRPNAHLRLGALAYGRYGATRLELGADSLQGRSLRVGAELAHDWPLSRNRSVRARGRVSALDGEREGDVGVEVRAYF